MSQQYLDTLPQETTVTRRRPVIAALMGAALPGFGQLYNGQFNRAIWFYLSFLIIAVPVTMIAALYLPAALTVGVLAISVLLTLGVWLWGIIDAWLVARRSNPYVLHNWQTSGFLCSQSSGAGFQDSQWQYDADSPARGFYLL